MKLSQFRFDLPDDLIAKVPLENREDSRLMVVDRKTQTITHRKFTDILEYFDEGDLMIVNNSKVFPARLYGNKERTNAEIEVFLLRELNQESKLWDVVVDPARKIRIGNKIYFNDDKLVAEVIDNTTSRGRTIRFLYNGEYEDFKNLLMEIGEMPIPKYMKRRANDLDVERFQTIFAKEEGSVSASASALHFDRILAKKMEIKGINFEEITLHLGLGSFKPIEVEDLTKHKVDSEWYNITEGTANSINAAKEQKKRICAVGTSTLRALESSVTSFKTVKPLEAWTNKFIYPPYECAIPNCLLTNFQAPKSILLMMVSSFGGYDLIMKAYQEAVREKYRFLAYGDAMLIL
jgi:S-adenosylmethionine:tRNA ribosyltransferase-isomerase